MKLPTILALILLVCDADASDDLRSKVADAQEEKSLSSVLDPDVGIYGIPFGTTEEMFVARYGKPSGYVRLSWDETAMIYGRMHAFLFQKERLSGVRITMTILDWKLSQTMGGSTLFDHARWRLTNGIAKDMDLKEVKKILGDKLSTDLYRRYYYTERSLVELDFSHYTSQGEGDDAFKVCGITIQKRGVDGKDLHVIQEFGGIGAVLNRERKDNKVVISDVIWDGPAAKAGIAKNDVLLTINGIATDGKTLSEVAKLLRGPAGSKVDLVLIRDSDKTQMQISLVREIIQVHGTDADKKRLERSRQAEQGAPAQCPSAASSK
ncbi:MAG TPA: PDZ domain-containing protein [Verrucomicrobiae bacterium]|nr:PDZ domain-containing protein [Verrucomicrobiae bacterium]